MNSKIFLAFAEAINTKNQLKLAELMTIDHCFIDPNGKKVSGNMLMLAGWAAYFLWFPDYKIEIETIVSLGETILATGYASGTYKGIKNKENSNYWRIPIAWKAIVRDNKISLWQVFGDTKIAYDIIQKNTLI